MNTAALDPELAPMVEALRRELPEVLGNELLGLYLYGSATTDGFDASISDIDMLAVLDHVVDDSTFVRLDALHRELLGSWPTFDNRLDISYLPREGLTHFPQSTRMAIITPGEGFLYKEADESWLKNWYLVRETGLTLFGPPPSAFIRQFSHEEYLEAVRGHVRWWQERILTPIPARYEAYAVLTMARALNTLREGVQPSKRQAAEWAAARYPEWVPVLQQSLERRTDWQHHGDVLASPTSEAVAFVEFVTARMDDL